jgi:hypothetical protein
MRVDYVSDDEDRELTYYEQLEVDYDEILAECEYRLQSIMNDMEKVVKPPRKLKRGHNLYEWIEQEMPAVREKYKNEAAFGADADILKFQLAELINGHVRAVLHPGDTYEEGCVLFLVYQRWQECDEEEWMDEEADRWLEENRENPAGMAMWTAENTDVADEADVDKAGAWVVQNPEEMAIAFWEQIDKECTAAEEWETLHPNVPEDVEVAPGQFGTNTECSDLVLKLRDNDPDLVLTEDLVQAESWAKTHPEELDEAHQRKIDEENAWFEQEKAEMAEQGFTWDDKTQKYYGINEETGEIYEYKTPEQIAAEEAAWGLFVDKEKGGRKYWYNEITGEVKYEDE